VVELPGLESVQAGDRPVNRVTELTNKSTPVLEFSGERFTPECVREIWYEHVHRYVLAREAVTGMRVLDAACGEGYGSVCLAGRAKHVTGVDVSAQSITHAAARYQAVNLSFLQADCRKLPFPDGHFDCIVSFETLEHMQEQEQLLAEFRRVLARNGFLLISSPDKAIYSNVMQNENPFHVRELERQEFEDLLATEFPAVRLMGQKLAFHSVVWPLQTRAETGPAGSEIPLASFFHRQSDGRTSLSETPSGDAIYLIAACAAETRWLPSLSDTVWWFDDEAESVYRHYHHEIGKNMSAGELLLGKDREIAALKAELQQGGCRPRNHWWQRWFKRW
jgi:SAM-dependent methyltransferase